MVESDIARGEYRGADAYRGQQVVAIDAEVSISAMVPDLLNEIERLEAALARVGKRPLAGLAPRPRMKWGTSPCGARVIVKWGERLYPIEPCTEHCNYGHHWPASSWRVLNEISFVATPTTTEDKT
jgi:hypothetical protein